MIYDHSNYRCRLNIQLKKHKELKHINDGKYNWNFCDFKTDYVIKIWEHKLQEHPQTSDEFNSKQITVKDMAVNMIAELNFEQVLNTILEI